MYSDNIPFVGLYNFNLGSYSEFIYTAVGYLGYSQYDNKIIIYNHIINKDFKEIEYKEELLKYEKKDYNDISTSTKIEKEIKGYDIMNKDLISCVFYSKDKKLFFISYSNNKELEIYNTKTKKLLKRIKIETELPTSYMSKTKDGKIIIKGAGTGYILNKELDVIARIPGLQDYKNNKLIINAWFKNYEVKMYSEKEVIAKAKKFLESKDRI
jgi:WD40 repeat protein